MAKRLTDNINSQYFEAINKMTPKKARRRIVVYVESYDDVFFWRSVLGRYEDDKLTFDIMLPSRNQHLDRGKKAAISNMLKGRTHGSARFSVFLSFFSKKRVRF